MRRTYRVFGVPVLSIETDETTAEAELTAGDNGGETRSERIDVGFVQGSIDRVDGWEDRG